MKNEKNQRHKQLTNYEIGMFGISPQPMFVNTIDELRNNPPNIIIAEATRDMSYRQNNFHREQKVIKKVNYVMALGVYQQLCHFGNNFKDKILKPSNFKFSKLYRPYNGEDLTDKTILIWRQGGIGDLLFISPNLRYIKEKYPTCKIIFACGPQYQSMVREWDFIDELIDLPFTVDYLFKSNYHIIFEGVIERTKEAETQNSYELFTKWMGLNLPVEILRPEQEANKESIDKCKKILSGWCVDEKSYIIMQMRSSSPIRTPRPSFWKNIIDGLTRNGHKILLTDSPHMVHDIDRFITTLENKDLVYNYCTHSDDISETIAATSLSKMAVAIDSSLIHIAESLKVKSFGLFGPFPGNIRLSTYKYSDWIDAKIDCSPCFKHGLNICSNAVRGFVPCYDSLNINEIVERIEKHV